MILPVAHTQGTVCPDASIDRRTALLTRHVFSFRVEECVRTGYFPNPAAPKLPTVIESGVPGYDTFDWQGIVGPKGMSRPIVDRLNSEYGKILRSKEVSERLLSDGLVPSPSSPEEFGTFIAREIEVVRKIVAKAGIKVD